MSTRMLTGSGMPQMRVAFGGWQRKITCVRRQQSVVAGLVEYTDYPFSFRGTMQPLSEKAITLKPDGQRAWAWYQLHCQAPCALNTNDQIIITGQIYKVMAMKDYSLNGYLEYHLVKDYQGPDTGCT